MHHPMLMEVLQRLQHLLRVHHNRLVVQRTKSVHYLSDRTLTHILQVDVDLRFVLLVTHVRDDVRVL